MELWIRSQDRLVLEKTTDICICAREGMSSIESKDFVLGMYETKERALEVLDEIQKLITPTINYNPVIKSEMRPEDTYARTTFERYETTIESLPCYVYEMPQE